MITMTAMMQMTRAMADMDFLALSFPKAVISIGEVFWSGIYKFCLKILPNPSPLPNARN